MEKPYFMQKPCKHCPFRRDVKPFLSAERGEELAILTTNPYNSFSCHKTTVSDEDSEDGEMIVTEDSLECAGFLSMQINEGAIRPDGFEVSDLVYEDYCEMIDAYQINEH